MKKIFIFLSVLYSIFSLTQYSYALEETVHIPWEKENISQVYNENDKKLHFLIQFKVSSQPIIDYDYRVEIQSAERFRSCDGNFTYSSGVIYTICSINIEDTKTLQQNISLKLEVENPENFETELDIFLKYNNLYNGEIDTFDWILDREEGESIESFSGVVDIDVLDSEESLITDLHEKGNIVIGYINVGSIEKYRDDYSLFPEQAVGEIYPGWEDERFLDIAHYSYFKDRILYRLDIAQEKGFDGIEADNMDSYDNSQETGFDISQDDMLSYISWLEKETRKRGMFLIQKNAPELSSRLVEKLDGALLEGAFYHNYEENFTNYIDMGKTVFNTEYTDNTTQSEFLKNICPKSQELGFISILKNRNLGNFILSCPKNEQSEQEMYLDLELKAIHILDAFFEKINKKYTPQQQKVIISQLQKRVSELRQETTDARKLFLFSLIEERITPQQWY